VVPFFHRKHSFLAEVRTDNVKTEQGEGGDAHDQ